MTHQCELLEWDSNFFGVRIARSTVNRLTGDSVESILSWCALNRIDCLYFLSAADDANTIGLLEDNRFRFVDVRVTYERLLSSVPILVRETFPGIIRQCVPQDIPNLKAIARIVHRESRFYYDPNFAPPRCDALYETWIEESCNGYADLTLVAEIEGCSSAYVTCHCLDSERGKIGLMGVNPEAQGQGIGQQLVGEAIRWFTGQGLKRVTVVTQARNWRAQRLYQRCGFLTAFVELWYHRWFGARR